MDDEAGGGEGGETADGASRTISGSVGVEGESDGPMKVWLAMGGDGGGGGGGGAGVD